MFSFPLFIRLKAIGRIALALLLVASFIFVAMPQHVAFAGDSESPLNVRTLGTCADATSRGGNGGLGVLAFGMGLDGTNLADTDPFDASEPLNGTFTVSGIPSGATIVEAWLYWNGSDLGNNPEDNPAVFNPTVNDGDPTIVFGGTSPITTTRVGGPVFFVTSDFSYAHRTDVTSVVGAAGNGTYTLTGIDNFANFVNGAELVIVYADPASDPQFVGLAEGLDLDPSLEVNTQPVIFQFDPAQVARTAQVTVFLGGAGYGTPETTAFYYRTDTAANLAPVVAAGTLITDTSATKVPDPFTGLNNQTGIGYWDSYTLSIPVPAGHSWVALQVDSETITGGDARLEWVGATMNMALACPELLVSKTRTTADYVQPGEAVDYQIVVSNVGNTNVLTATLQDSYDTAYLDFSSASPAPVSSLDDGVLDWTNIGPINYGNAVTITVNFTATASTEPIVGPPADRTINTAVVTSVTDENGNTDSPSNYPSDDPNTPQDENPLADTDSVEITQPGVTLSKGLVTPADGSTTVGSEVVYTITVTNSGDTILNTVPVTDTYDNSLLTYGFGGVFSTPANSDGTANDGALSWSNVGPLAVGASTTITIHFTAAASTQNLSADLTYNNAGTNGVVDENGDSPGDARDQAPVEIGNPRVSISKTLASPISGPAAVSDEVVFVITVSNTGDTILSTVPVTDTYDPNFLSYGFGGVFSTPANSDGTADDGALAWNNVGPLALGASTTITVHFTAVTNTDSQPNSETINYSGVSGVVDENNDSPAPAQAQAPVQIVNRGVIGDYVWYDADNDGIQDVTESGLGNVTIDLKDGGGGVVASTTTDADGGYIFTDLAPDIYTVHVTDLNGVLGGFTATTGPESQSEPLVVALGAGEIYREADFGYVYSSAQAVVGDTVWYDPNQNGVRDAGEAAIPGVTVTLFDADTGLSTGLVATTNINGNYLITGVAPGNYYVDATTGVPAGVTPSTGAPAPTAVFVIAPGDQYLDADIGYVVSTPAAIAGTVWDDSANSNGILDETAAGIAGVSVDLLDAAGNVLATATTNTTGDFSFPGLPAGTYRVQVTDTQNVLHNYVPTTIIGGTGDNTNKAQPYTIVLPAGGNNTTADFGYVLDNTSGDNGMIGNQVWYDVDGDGVYEPQSGDVGVEGVTVELLNAVGQVITSTTTGAGGDYVFTGLAAGSYQVRVSDTYGVLTGFVDTTFPADQSADNNNKVQAYAITLASDERNMTADFGYTGPAALGDFVWYDANNDGVQDVGEPGIANVTLDLYDAGGDGLVGGGDDTLLASTVSDADGGYLFANLSPGSYYVDVTDTNGVLTTFTLTSGPQSETDPSGVVTLSPGDVSKDTDFGYVQTPVNDAIIGDTVFYDANADGIQQPDEPGIPGVIVCATLTGGGTPICDTTDSNGHYLLDVPAGNYNVAPTSTPSGYTATTPVPQIVGVAAGDQYLDADFGYDSNTLLGSIGNFVFEDVDASGDYSSTVDNPFTGVSVDLIRDTNGNFDWDSGEPIIATATTDANGAYLFSAVPAGYYLVHVSDTNAVLIDYVKAPLGAAGVDNNNQADPYSITLGAGASNLTADFGYYPAGRRDIGVIGNQLWIERDYDGIFDPGAGDDFGQPGVTVDLYRNGSYYGRTTTGASGDYSFSSLPSGVYTVTVSDSANVVAAYLHTFYPADQTSDDTNKIEPYTVALAQGAISMVSDFGYVEPATVGNYVWIDLNANGAQDVGESGLGGVQVELYNSVTSTPMFTVTTDANGIYTFTMVPPGNYFVKFHVTGAYTYTVNNVSGPGISDVNDSDANPSTAETAGFSIGAGQVNDTLDAGVYEPITIGDMIFRDSNGDKVQQAGETGGIPNVPISITNLSTLQVYNYMSDANGIYTATNLPPGTYSISVPNTLPLLIRTTDSPIQTTLLSGQSDLTVDFGYINPTAVQMADVSYSVSKKGVQLQWTTVSEDADDSFSIYRSTREDGIRKLLTPQSIPATGSPSGASYTFDDTLVTPGQTYYYWIAIEPQSDIVGPIVVPFFAPQPGDGDSFRLFAPLVIR